MAYKDPKEQAAYDRGYKARGRKRFCPRCYARKKKYRYPKTAERASWKYRGVDLSTVNRPKPLYCESCGNGGRMCLDHDHVTGRFRGWLCNSCNRAIGFCGDSPIRLRAAASYLERE